MRRMNASVRRSFLALLFILLVHVTRGGALGPQMTANFTSVKTTNLVGYDITAATLTYDFDRPLYRTWAPACAKGFCEAEPPNLDDPCFPGCDFTLKGELCGTHPNPECDCSAIRNATGWCEGDQDWITLKIDEPSELLTTGWSTGLSFRYQHTQPCHAVSFHLLGSGSLNSYLNVGVMGPVVSLDHVMGLSSVPENYLSICPDHPQFRFGTWFLSLKKEYSVSLQVLVRTHDVSAPLPLPSPLPTCESPNEEFTCILAGQSVYFDALPFSSPTRFVYTTDKCERIHLMVQPTVHPPYQYITYLMYDFDKQPRRPEQAQVTYNNNFFVSLSVPMTVCPAEGKDTVSVYISVGFLSVPDGYGIVGEALFTIERENEFWETVALTDSPKFLLWGDYRSTMELHCGGDDDDESGLVLYCRPGTEKSRGGCNLLRGISPNADNIPMENRLATLRDVDLQAFGPINYDSWLDMVENRASYALLLDHGRAGKREYFFQDWETVLPTCRVKFLASGSLLHDEHGHWFEKVVPINMVDPACDPQRFVELNQLVEDRLTEVNRFEDVFDLMLVQTRRFSVDVLTMADAWVGCTRFCEDLLDEETKMTTLQGTLLCSNEGLSDPCCNQEVAWKDTCCQTRDIVTNLTALTKPRDELISDTCVLPDCTALKVQDLATLSVAVENTQACSSAALEQAESTTERSLRFYGECKARFLGSVDSHGLSCAQDVDCHTGVCDRAVGKCLYERAQQERLFLGCLLENLSDSFRDSLSRFMGWDFSPDTLQQVENLMEQYSTVACVGNHSVWSPLRSHFIRSSSLLCSQCSVVADLYCLDQSCPFPLWCGPWSRLQPDPKCGSYWDVLERGILDCPRAPATCNWSPLISDRAECEAGSAFCAICLTPTECSPLSQRADVDTREQCEQTVACSLADGSLRTDLSAAECEAEFRCSALCPGGVQCGSREQCEAVGGRCTDPSYAVQLIESADGIVDGEVTGYCLFENAPFNSPDCSAGNLYNAVLDIGCVRFAECTEQGCTWINRDRGECVAAGGSWIPREIPRGECEVRGCDDYSIQLLTPKSEQQCGECGGSMQKAREWVAGRWLGGVVRQTRWLEPALQVQYSSQQALDFLTLFDDMIQAANFEYHFYLQTELECYLNPLRTLVEELTCACSSEEAAPDGSQCFVSTEPQVASARFCKGSINQVGSLHVHLSALQDSFEDGCAEIVLRFVSNRYFDPAPTPLIATGLHRRIQVPDPIAHQTVYTSRGILVGQVAGDGAEIVFTRGRLRSAWICLSLNSDIVVNVNYTRADFALRIDQSSVRPLQIENMVVETERLCGEVQFHSEKLTVLPIFRFTNEQIDSLSSASTDELLVLWVVACCFAVGSVLMCVCQCFHIVKISSCWRKAVFWLNLWFLITVVMRSVYLFLVAGEVLAASTTLLTFWLIDFPLICYLIGNVAISISFLLLLLRPTYTVLYRPMVFRVSYAIVSTVLIVWFLLILVLFQVLVIQGEDAADFCTVQEGTTDAEQRSENARILRLTYQLVVGAVALVVGGMELVLGLYLAKGVIGVLVPLMAVSSSLGVLLDSIAWVVYTAVDAPTPYFSVVLLFTELLPICVVASVAVVTTLRTSGETDPPSHDFKSAASDTSRLVSSITMDSDST
mmetsp:Transcript_13956/g.42009  ORF Transcript_13956/g.42009 Transcript_13956/m.42009 type:complete len:1642 (-) Transcript_13956:93-5018(-)